MCPFVTFLIRNVGLEGARTGVGKVRYSLGCLTFSTVIHRFAHKSHRFEQERHIQAVENRGSGRW